MKILKLVIKIDSNISKILTIKETKSGDLNIHTTSGGKTFMSDSFNDLVFVSDESKFKESSKHISVHCNPKSNKTHTIKKTIEINDKVINSTLVSHGIKVNKKFIPVLFRVCGDQSRERYIYSNIKENESVVDFGNYNPVADQLRLLLFVGNEKQSFNYDVEHPSNYKFIDFNKFRLHILWSYLNMPSRDHAIDFTPSSKKENGSVDGLEWFEMYNLFTDLNMMYISKYFEISESEQL